VDNRLSRPWTVFLILWASAVLVVGLLTFREYEQQRTQAEVDQFYCSLGNGTDC